MKKHILAASVSALAVMVGLGIGSTSAKADVFTDAYDSVYKVSYETYTGAGLSASTSDSLAIEDAKRALLDLQALRMTAKFRLDSWLLNEMALIKKAHAEKIAAAQTAEALAAAEEAKRAAEEAAAKRAAEEAARIEAEEEAALKARLLDQEREAAALEAARRQELQLLNEVREKKFGAIASYMTEATSRISEIAKIDPQFIPAYMGEVVAGLAALTGRPIVIIAEDVEGEMMAGNADKAAHLLLAGFGVDRLSEGHYIEKRAGALKELELISEDTVAERKRAISILMPQPVAAFVQEVLPLEPGIEDKSAIMQDRVVPVIKLLAGNDGRVIEIDERKALEFINHSAFREKFSGDAELVALADEFKVKTGGLTSGDRDRIQRLFNEKSGFGAELEIAAMRIFPALPHTPEGAVPDAAIINYYDHAPASPGGGGGDIQPMSETAYPVDLIAEEGLTVDAVFASAEEMNAASERAYNSDFDNAAKLAEEEALRLRAVPVVEFHAADIAEKVTAETAAAENYIPSAALCHGTGCYFIRLEDEARFSDVLRRESAVKDLDALLVEYDNENLRALRGRLFEPGFDIKAIVSNIAEANPEAAEKVYVVLTQIGFGRELLQAPVIYPITEEMAALEKSAGETIGMPFPGSDTPEMIVKDVHETAASPDTPVFLLAGAADETAAKVLDVEQNHIYTCQALEGCNGPATAPTVVEGQEHVIIDPILHPEHIAHEQMEPIQLEEQAVMIETLSAEEM